MGQPDVFYFLAQATLARIVSTIEALRAVSFFQASCANVTSRFFTVFNVRNFLYVYFERSSGLAVGVAYVVTRRLSFATNITYSRHIDTSDLRYFLDFI